MTNEQILEKAIEKAVKNGWKIPADRDRWVYAVFDGTKSKYIFKPDYEYEGHRWALEEIIFNHDFAKAFWGSGSVYLLDVGQKHDVKWQYHLREMVVKKEPLKYLAKFLK